MRVHVLGSAAGGGVPQWNCACRICKGVREGSLPVRPRSQTSVAVSADGEAWALLHASPDVARQIEGFPALHPREVRGTPIAAVLLANGDLDACMGLLALRESQPLSIHATAEVESSFTRNNALYRTLQRFDGHVRWQRLEPARERAIVDVDGRALRLAVTAIPVPGKVPVHRACERDARPGDNVALRIRDLASGRVLVWVPCIAGPTPDLEAMLREADCVLFDGTFWSSDELLRAGAASMRAEAMGHWPLGGPGGSLELLARLRTRKILVHLNNTNPVLVEDSAERAAVTLSGVEVAVDGLEITP